MNLHGSLTEEGLYLVQLDNIRTTILNQRLEKVIHVARNLKLFSIEQLNILNPKRIYGQNLFHNFHIEALHLPYGKKERLNLITG